jgi:hypothetical protein
MVMNTGLQRRILEKFVINNCRERGLSQHDIDPIIEGIDWESFLDPTRTLRENRNNLFRHGIIEHLPSDEKFSDQYYEHNYRLELKLLESLSNPVFQCEVEGCEYSTKSKRDMSDHYFEKHGLESDDIPPINPDDMTYIILDKLIDIAQNSEFRRKRYLTVSNKSLHDLLLQKLGFDENDENAPSNQKPRQILEALGLLGEEKYQRINTVAFDKNSRKIYNIYKNTLKQVIEDSIYKGLALKIHTSLNPLE